ncbi:MAG TPA: hypothetical protein VIX12_03150, partial [Candidatus Binataceae bacterium]
MARQIALTQARIEYTGIAALTAILRARSPEGAVKIGAAFGAIAMRLDFLNRPIAMRNLEIAFPEMTREDRLGVLDGMYRNWGRLMAEWVHMGRFDRSNIERYATYEGREYLDEAERISNGRGLLILTAHYGNFELLSLAHSIYGNRIAIVYRPIRNPLIDRAVRDARTRFGNQIVERKKASLEMARLLRKNWMVAIALDLDVRKGVFVD